MVKRELYKYIGRTQPTNATEFTEVSKILLINQARSATYICLHVTLKLWLAIYVFHYKLISSLQEEIVEQIIKCTEGECTEGDLTTDDLVVKVTN